MFMFVTFIHSGYLHSASSRNLVRGALSPAAAKEKCLKNLAEKDTLLWGSIHYTSVIVIGNLRFYNTRKSKVGEPGYLQTPSQSDGQVGPKPDPSRGSGIRAGHGGRWVGPMQWEVSVKEMESE